MADDMRKELDALKADIARLRADIGNLTDAAKSTAGDNVKHAKAEAQQRLSQAWEDIEARLEGLLDEGKATFDNAERKIGEHPTGSLLTAFGLGFVIAKLLNLGDRR